MPRYLVDVEKRLALITTLEVEAENPEVAATIADEMAHREIFAKFPMPGYFPYTPRVEILNVEEVKDP